MFIGFDMGRESKNRGRTYEYRVRDWFRSRADWDEEKTIRVPLSGACEILDEKVGKYDVVAVHRNGKLILEIECKKTGGSVFTLKREWIDKLNFSKTEFLVFALDKTKHYCLLPIEIYDDKDVQVSKKIKGKKTFRINKKDIIDDHLKFEWSCFEECFYILPLSEYIQSLEKEEN